MSTCRQLAQLVAGLGAEYSAWKLDTFMCSLQGIVLHLCIVYKLDTFMYSLQARYSYVV